MGCGPSKGSKGIYDRAPAAHSSDIDVERRESDTNVEAIGDLSDANSESVQIVLSSSSQHSGSVDVSAPKVSKKRTISKGRKAVFSKNNKDKVGPSRAKTPKDSQLSSKLAHIVANCYLFSDMNEIEQDEVVSFLWQEKVKVGSLLISQGKKSDTFYMVENGTFEMIMNGKVVGSRTATSEEPFFGENALIFGTRASASVKCVSSTNEKGSSKGKHALVWALDRQTYRHIISAQLENNRIASMTAVQSIPLLANNLTKDQQLKLVDAMEIVRVRKGQRIIKKGDHGSMLYFIKSGLVTCNKIGEEELGEIELGSGQYFGELALLNDEPRAADVSTLEDSVLLCLEKKRFTELLGPLATILDENMKTRVVESVPILNQLSKNLRSKVLAQFELCSFKDKQAIIREGTDGDRFFIVRSGVVDVYRSGKVEERRASSGSLYGSSSSGISITIESKGESSRSLKSKTSSKSKGKNKSRKNSAVDYGEKIATLHPGDWFGEIALLNDDLRTASCVANGPVECFSLPYSSFKIVSKKSELLLEISSRRMEENNKNHKGTSDGGIEKQTNTIDFSKLGLKDIVKNKILGKGTFGTVYLVESTPKSPIQGVWALKMMNKAHIVECEQTTNVVNEKLVLQEIRHPFVLTLFTTLQDRDSLYMLLEFVQGGELFSIMQQHYRLPLSHAQFYSACIIDALDYMHKLGFVYRDLKPENVLIDAEGFAKIADFGFAKRISGKTFTLCGTPEYLAPEVVLGKGHDKGVDYWAVGILIYEMLAGISPFADEHTDDQIVVCKQIVSGKVNFDVLEKAIVSMELSPPKSFTEKELKYLFGSNSLDSTKGSNSTRRPSRNSRPVEQLIRKLLTKSAHNRLGCLKDGAADVKKHAFFNLDNKSWKNLRKRKFETPYTPSLSSKTDTSNFDDFEADAKWDAYDGPNDWCSEF